LRAHRESKDMPVVLLAKPAEELAYVTDEEVGHLHGREVATPIELRPVLVLVVRVHHRPHERLGGEERPPLRRRARRTPLRRVCGLV
jgi:hypothetical protein